MSHRSIVSLRLPEGAPTCTDQEWSATPRPIQLLVRFLLAALASALERLASNSTNSSLPPSSDRPHEARRRRGRKKRRCGAQPGHRGQLRPLVEASKVTRIEEVKPKQCRRCGVALRGTDPAPMRAQYVDAPPVTPIIIEYRAHALCCRRCGEVTRGELPWDVQCSPFSPRLEAKAVSLVGEYKLSRRAAQAMMKAWLGVEMSLGAVSACEKRANLALAEPVREAHDHVVAQAPVAHADETRFREGRRKTWVWVLTTPMVVLFVVQARRTTAAAKKLLLGFKGVLVCDRLASYHCFTGSVQTCWAHLARLWKKWMLRGGESAELGKELSRLTRRMFHWWHRLRKGQLTSEAFTRKMNVLRRQVEDCLTRAAACTDTKTAKTATNLLKRREQLWVFVAHEGVEPTNNAAELAARAAVLWRKQSYGTRSRRGSRFAERILTTTETLKRQRRDVVDFLTEAIQAFRAGTQPPSLLPSPQPCIQAARAA